MQRALIVAGLFLVVVGLAWPWISRFPFGRLPGDIAIEKDNLRVYVPVVTMILVSAIVSAILWLFRK